MSSPPLLLAGVLIGKEVFGGYGSYPFHPAAVGYAVAAVSWPEQVFRYPQPHTPISRSGTPPAWPTSSTISDTLRSGGMHQHQRPVAGSGRVCRPDGHRCSHRAGGLRPLPLDAEGCRG
ncbi:MAG: RnfABCDGE type electron transport complex subunit D [Faecalibacterium prausnitzii]